MSWGVLNAAMLLGLAGAALPVIIHLLNRRRDTVIDWGAMQFLDLGRRARRRIRLTELLLMLARMALLALVALALARPFWAPRRPRPGDAERIGAASAATPRRATSCSCSTAPRAWTAARRRRPRAPGPSRGPGGSSASRARATRWPSSSPASGSAP